MPFGFRHHLDDILVLLSRAIAVNIGNDIVYLLLVFLLLLQLLDEGTDFFLIEGAPYKLLRGTLMNQEQTVFVHSDLLGAHRTDGGGRCREARLKVNRHIAMVLEHLTDGETCGNRTARRIDGYIDVLAFVVIKDIADHKLGPRPYITGDRYLIFHTT